MDNATVGEMLAQADVLEARETMLQFKIAEYPQLKSTQKEKLHKAVYKQANPPQLTESKRVKISDLAQVMGLGNGK